VKRKAFNWPLALGLGIVVIVLDQWSKHAITAAFRYGEVMPVTSFFNLVLVHNKGAAFSFLSGASGWQREFFIGVTALALAVIIWMVRRHREELLFCWGLACVAAGAVGNLIDRVSYGYVVDFLDFHAAGWHFWAFNLADSSITLCAGMLILDSFRPRPATTS
jgi:signal peptidase II